MLTNYWKFQNRSVQTFGFVHHDTNSQNHGPKRKTQMFLLSEICTVILWQDCYGKGNLRKSIETWMGENSKLGMSLCTSWKRIILICVCGWHKIGWKEAKSSSDVESIQKRSRFGRTNIVLQRQCEISKDTVDNYRTMFESRISAVWVEKLPCPQNLRISSWSYDMAGHAKKCVERFCELANKTTQQLYKVSTPCIHDHHASMTTTSKKKKQNLLENCQIHALKLFWNAYTWQNWTTWYFMVSE